MNHAEWIFDVILIAGLVALAIESVAGRTLFRSMMMFIVFSFTMALAWARLGAPDLALAEAAIGAGITGALVLAAYQRLGAKAPATEQADRGREEHSRKPADRRHSRLSAPIAITSGILVAIIGWSALGMSDQSGIAGQLALSSSEDRGVKNPVTAVLVIFRNYDTLIEITVLLTALLGAQAVTETGSGHTRPSVRIDTARSVGDIALVANLRAVVVPFALVVAAYLLQSGTSEPGGAFQAGAVLAASAVLLILSGQLEACRETGLLLRLGVVLSLVVFVLCGYAMHWWGAGMLALPGVAAVYLIETTMMISVALILTLLFAGSTSLRWRPK